MNSQGQFRELVKGLKHLQVEQVQQEKKACCWMIAMIIATVIAIAIVIALQGGLQ